MRDRPLSQARIRQQIQESRNLTVLYSRRDSHDNGIRRVGLLGAKILSRPFCLHQVWRTLRERKPAPTPSEKNHNVVVWRSEVDEPRRMLRRWGLSDSSLTGWSKSAPWQLVIRGTSWLGREIPPCCPMAATSALQKNSTRLRTHGVVVMAEVATNGGPHRRLRLETLRGESMVGQAISSVCSTIP